MLSSWRATIPRPSCRCGTAARIPRRGFGLRRLPDGALMVYRSLIEEGAVPGKIVVAGDSAGANLVMSLLQQARDVGLPMPAGTVLLCPWLDLALNGQSVTDVGERDAFLDANRLRASARGYLGEIDATDPRASPLYAKVHGLPPLFIQTTSEDLLLDDALRFAAIAARANIKVTLGVAFVRAGFGRGSHGTGRGCFVCGESTQIATRLRRMARQIHKLTPTRGSNA